jgi:tetratricopeptide (TPR) repeat protein
VALIISIFGFSIVLNPSSQFSENILERLNLGTIGGRTITWEISNKGFLERPMLGWGPENYYLAFAKNYDPCLGTDRCGGDTLYDRAHNFWHDNLISFGIIGSIFYFFLFFSVLFFLWKNYLNKNIGFFDAGIFTSLFGAYFIQGLTVFDVVSSLMVIFIVIAFISSLSKSEYNYKNIKEPNFVIIGIIILLSIFYINYFVINPYKSSGYVLEAFNENPNIDKKKEILEKAIYTSPLGRGHIIKNLSLRVFNKERFDSNSLKEVEFFIDEVKDELTSVPIDYNNKVILGRLYLLYVNIFIAINEKNITEEITIEALKYVDMAGEIFEEAIEISPNKQDAYWYLAETRVRQGKVEEAFSLSQKAVELEPKILNSHIYLIRIAKDILGDRELALEKVREAQEINPNWDFSPILND